MPFTYAIADLHGRYDLLSEAVTKIVEHSKSDRPATIITLGDYVDRGPKSRQVIERLMDWGSPHLKLVCLKGNHEDILRREVGDECRHRGSPAGRLHVRLQLTQCLIADRFSHGRGLEANAPAEVPEFPSPRRGALRPAAPSRTRAPRSGARARATRRTRRLAPRA